MILSLPWLIVLSSVSGPAPAQDSRLRRVDGPVESVDLDLATGVVTRGARARERSAATAVTFNNLDLAGFIGVDTGNCQCEWYDAAVKSGGRSSYVSGFTFAYCSAALDPRSGGPGGSVELSFRSGYTLGGNGAGQPPNGTEVARMLMTGLPANTGNSSFFGGVRCFLITLRLGSTFCLPDGSIGYGWKFVDQGTPGVLAQTMPILSCVQSCSGPGPDGLGMTECFDFYCPPGVGRTPPFVGCHELSPGGPALSMSMELRELESTGAYASAIYAATNTALLFDQGGAPGFGPNLDDVAEPYGLGLDCSAATTSGAYRIDIRPDLIAAGVPTGFGLLAATGPLLQKFTGVHLQSTVATPTVSVPKDVSFACLAYTNQGWCQSSPRGILSNAIRETIGVP